MEYSLHTFLKVKEHGITFVGDSGFAIPLKIEEIENLLEILNEAKKSLIENEKMINLIRENKLMALNQRLK